MHRRRLILFLLPLLLGGVLSSALFAAENESDTDRSAKTMALPETYKLTLTLNEGGETFVFSMTVASRHFAMNLGEKNIALRGRIWQENGSGELLDYTLEYTQWVDGPEAGKQRRGSTWNGSTHLRHGKPTEIARFLSGSFAIRFDPVM